MVVLTLVDINVPSVDNHKSSERVDKPTDVVLLLTEPDTLFSTLSMANLSDTTQITLSNTLRLI